MRGSLRTAGVVLCALLVTAGAAGCAGDHAAEPTVASVDFTPRLVLEVDEQGLSWQRGPKAGDVDLQRPDVPNGAVIEVINTGEEPHRVEGDTWFDTGMLQPGERTVVVLSKQTTEPKTLELRARDDRDHRATIVVQASPPPS